MNPIKCIIFLIPVVWLLYVEAYCLITQEFLYFRFVSGMLFFWIIQEIIKELQDDN